MGLSLFDDDVTPNVKDEIVQAMFSSKEKETPAKKATVALENIQSLSLATFVSSNTCIFFQKLKLPQAFLQLPASQWEENNHYQIAKSFCKRLAVTNDHAERGVALLQTFSGHLTKDEEQLQYLLQVVSQHRKDFPDAHKHTLTGQQ